MDDAGTQPRRGRGFKAWLQEHKGAMAASIAATVIGAGVVAFLGLNDGGGDTAVYYVGSPVGSGAVPEAPDQDVGAAGAGWRTLYEAQTTLERRHFEYYTFRVEEGPAGMSYSVSSDGPMEVGFIRAADVGAFAEQETVDAWGFQGGVTDPSDSADLRVDLDDGEYAFVALCMAEAACVLEYWVEHWA